MMKNKTIFVGGDFIESQYLWIIPFINGYCKNNKIKNILFEVPLTYRLQNNKDLLKILDNYNIKILQYNHLYYLGFFFLFF